MGNHRRNDNNLNMAIPMLDSQGNVEGWFHFKDEYLSPEVRYTAFPPTTWLRLGGRFLEIDRAVPLKIRLLEAHEDYHFWCKKKQHSQRINCGEYHKDFGDVEIGYSFSSPQTHIWFAGYAIHADCFENLFLSSHNASVRVTPEHVIPQKHTLKIPHDKSGHAVPMSDLVPSRSLFEMVLDEGADFPIYTAAVPVRVETHKGYKTELVPTAEFINDCERDIIKRDAYDVGAAVAQISDPVSYPPTFPPIKPFEHAGLFWSFIYNELLNKRLSRDELEQAVKDIALLNRSQEYDSEVRKRDAQYNAALERLCRLFATPETMHKLTWPATDVKCEDCKCGCCRKHTHPLKTHNNLRRLRERRDAEEDPHLIICPGSMESDVSSAPSPDTPPRHGYTEVREHHHRHRHTRQRRDGEPSPPLAPPAVERRSNSLRRSQSRPPQQSAEFRTPSIRRQTSNRYHTGHQSRLQWKGETGGRGRGHPGMPLREWNAAEVEAAGKKLSEVYKAPRTRSAGYDSGVVELPGSNAPLMFISGGARGEREKPVYVEASLMEVPGTTVSVPQYSRPTGLGSDGFNFAVRDEFAHPPVR